MAFLCRPQSLPNPRMLVVHRTGCGKTATMIQIADNYFLDRRPKVLVFPTNAVCASFYRELRNPYATHASNPKLQPEGCPLGLAAPRLAGPRASTP